ncbi:MAG: MATE family multidrug resistance protein [Planctomycetota bacterium]|jgi:MATE family multidrug resistance protein
METWRTELRAQMRLALPVVVIQLGLMSMGLVDTAFVGRFGVADQAAVQMAHGYAFLFLGFGMGVLSALDPLVSQAFGAKDEGGMRRAIQRATILALLLTVPIMVGVALTETVIGLEFFGQPKSVVPIAGEYATISLLSVLPFLLFFVLKQALQAMHIMRPLVIAIIATNLLNVVLDWALVFGHLGFPAMGAPGSSWATVVSRWALMLSVLWVAWPQLRPYLRHADAAARRPRPLLRMVGLGWPVGFSWTFEIGAFYAVLLMVGQFGEVWLAAHVVTMSISSASFMIPLGVSIAGSVRVGNAIGASDGEAMRRSARVALILGAGVMVIFAALFLIIPEPFARVFSDKPEVLAFAVVLIPLAGWFQVFDGTQVVCSGILRGAGDTRMPMFIQIFGFWGLGMPVAYWLGIHRDGGPSGLWWGLVAGLAIVALLQVWRVIARLSGEVRRTNLEDEEPSLARIDDGEETDQPATS